MNLAEFPLTVLSTRVDPTVKTLEFSDFQKGKDGELTERKWIITGADKFGLPTATDDDVILGLIRLTMDDGFRSRKVYFTRYELLRALQWSTEGRSYTRLVKSLDRLSGVRIRASNAFYDNSSKSYQTKNFGIVDAYELNDHRSVRKLPKSTGKSGASSSSAKSRRGELADEAFRQNSGADILRDSLDPGAEESGKSYFIWSEMLFNSFRSGFIKKLDLDLYFSLRSSVSRRLYRYLDKHFYFRPSIERPLMILAFEKLGISRNYKYVSSIKQQLEPAAEELLSVGYLSGYEFFGKGEQAMVRFFAAREGEAIRRDYGGQQPSSEVSREHAFSQRYSPEPAAPYSLQDPPPSPRDLGSRDLGPRDFGTKESPVETLAFSSSHPSTSQDGQRDQRGSENPGSYPSHRSDERAENNLDYQGLSETNSTRGTQDEEQRLRSQLIEALVSRGINISQAKRLLADPDFSDLQQIDRIVSYYDYLLENHDSKISRNKVGFLYRAVETPRRFQIPPNFAQQQSEASSSQKRVSPAPSPKLSPRRSPSLNADDPGLKQAKLRQAYFEFVSTEVTRRLHALSEREREELRRRVEEKMAPLGTALSPERFEEAIQGCMREEITRAYKIPDFRNWVKTYE